MSTRTNSSVILNEDAQYLNAIERGDLVRASEILKCVGRKHGFELEPVWHAGTIENNYDPSKADMDGLYGPAFYTSANRLRAEDYGGVAARPYFLKRERTFDCDAHISKCEALRISTPLGNERVFDSLFADVEAMGTPMTGEDVWNTIKDASSPLLANELLQLAGYDSATYTGNDGEERDFLVFSPTQIKSADVLTHHPDGSPVAPTIRFSAATDISGNVTETTQSRDSEYMRAVERNDSATMQRMVADEALRAGFHVRAKHGTPNEDFFTFEQNHRGASENETSKVGWWFTDSHDAAAVFATREDVKYVTKTVGEMGEGSIRNSFSNESHVARLLSDPSQVVCWADGQEMQFAHRYEQTGKVMDVFLKLENPKVFGRGEMDGFEEMMDYRDQWTEYINGARGEPGSWRRRYIGMDAAKTNEMFRVAIEADGHDGLEIRTVYDSTDSAPIQQFAVWDPRQIKSANPIERDGGGRVIPLSARFDSTHADIRGRVDADLEVTPASLCLVLEGSSRTRTRGVNQHHQSTL